MRLKPRFILPLLIFVLTISYQNFSSVSPNDFPDDGDTALTLKIMNEMSEFEKNASAPKAVLATPQGGSDLKSVSNNWMERQGSILLNGYDKEVEAAVNDKLNTWVQSISSKESSKEDSRDPAEVRIATSEPTPSAAPEAPRKMKQNFRFSRVNALKYDLGESTSLDLVADPGNTRLNYSQSLSSNSKLGVEHRTSDNKTQMLFRYDW